MKLTTWIGIAVVVVLLLFAIGNLYVKDSATVEQAIIVEKYIKDYCRAHNKYPEFENVENQFPKLYPNQEWYYWPNETWTVATFQYPMTLPLSSASGRSKVSEFFPIIYAYAVRHPCKNIIKGASSGR